MYQTVGSISRHSIYVSYGRYITLLHNVNIEGRKSELINKKVSIEVDMVCT